MQSMNPVFNERSFSNVERSYDSTAMTLEGAINKSIVAIVLCLGAGVLSFQLNVAPNLPLFLGAGIGGFVLVLAASFKPHWAPVITPFYAILQGTFLGAISLMYNAQFNGLPVQAVLLTFTILFVMLMLYRTRVIQVTDRFRTILVSCLFAIMATYLISMVLGFFGTTIPYIHDSGPIGILFSVAVVGVASFFLLIDFDNIERGVRMGAPKHMEWFSALGLLVTLVWLYLEVLKLLAKIQQRR